MISKKILKISGGYGFSDDYAGGYFFTTKNGTTTHECSCRDEFFGYFHKSTDMVGFTSPKLDIKLLNDFFTRIEKQLKLKSKEQTVFYHTSIKNAVIIEVSEFWRDNETRRSLFTLFLRCGAVYYRGDFDKAISSYSLAKGVKNAINWFLKGYTTPTFQSIDSGFYEKFNGLDNSSLSKLLTQKSLISYGKGINMYPLNF